MLRFRLEAVVLESHSPYWLAGPPSLNPRPVCSGPARRWACIARWG